MWFLSFYKPDKKQRISKTQFQAIFKEQYADLCLYASRFINDNEAAKDIVQEVLTSFWIDSDKLRNKALIKPYLFKSVKHKALNFIKREKRKSPLDALFDSYNEELATSENESVESYFSMNLLMHDLEDAMSELPEQRRKIFKMSRFENLKHKEIAEQLNISPKTVETHIFRTLQFLRQRLKHHL